MLSSGLFSGLRNLPTRSISKETSRTRNRVARIKTAENPVPIENPQAVCKKSFTNSQKSRSDNIKPKRVIQLKYPLQTLPPSTKPSGWLDPLGNTEHLPFQFVRTPTKQLPVYSDIKNGRSRRVTVLRKYVGDSNEIQGELKRLIGDDVKIEQYAGRIEVQGHHVAKIKRWLRRLGF